MESMDNAHVAHTVERLPCKQDAGGSTPPLGSMLLEMENNRLDADRLNECTLCGKSTKSEKRKHNGVGWIQGWVHVECADAQENV
jgi:hypothetical protein